MEELETLVESVGLFAGLEVPRLVMEINGLSVLIPVELSNPVGVI